MLLARQGPWQRWWCINLALITPAWKVALVAVRERYKPERMAQFCRKEPILSAFAAVMVTLLLDIFL